MLSDLIDVQSNRVGWNILLIQLKAGSRVKRSSKNKGTEGLNKLREVLITEKTIAFPLAYCIASLHSSSYVFQSINNSIL